MPAGVDTIVRVTFSFVHGLAVAMVLPIYFMMYPEFSKTYLYVILFAIIPAFSYVFSLALNSLTQYISCGTVVFGQIALASIFNPIFVLIFAFISWMFPVLRTFVNAILPEQPLDVMKQEGDTTMKMILSYAFYILWGGIYGQTYSAGFAQSCPSATLPIKVIEPVAITPNQDASGASVPK